VISLLSDTSTSVRLSATSTSVRSGSGMICAVPLVNAVECGMVAAALPLFWKVLSPPIPRMLFRLIWDDPTPGSETLPDPANASRLIWDDPLPSKRSKAIPWVIDLARLEAARAPIKAMPAPDAALCLIDPLAPPAKRSNPVVLTIDLASADAAIPSKRPDDAPDAVECRSVAAPNPTKRIKLVLVLVECFSAPDANPTKDWAPVDVPAECFCWVIATPTSLSAPGADAVECRSLEMATAWISGMADPTAIECLMIADPDPAKDCDAVLVVFEYLSTKAIDVDCAWVARAAATECLSDAATALTLRSKPVAAAMLCLITDAANPWSSELLPPTATE
jgi:hypothetical protein